MRLLGLFLVVSVAGAPGIDLLFHGDQQRLEYDFHVAPGASSDRIALSFAGAERTQVDTGGDLLFALQLRRHPPTGSCGLANHRRP